MSDFVGSDCESGVQFLCCGKPGQCWSRSPPLGEEDDEKRGARPKAYAKNQLHSMIEKGDVAGLLLALFSIVVVKIIVTLVKAFCGLLKEIGNLVVAMTYTAIFVIQLTTARHRALQGKDQRIRWFGRATILRAADILVLA